MWLAATVAAAVTLVGNVGDTYRQYDNLATDSEVAEVMATHKTEMAAAVAEWDKAQDVRVAGLEEKLDRLIVGQARKNLGDELANLYRVKCRTGARDLDDSIDRLRRQYRAEVHENYQVKTCDEYLM